MDSWCWARSKSTSTRTVIVGGDTFTINNFNIMDSTILQSSNTSQAQHSYKQLRNIPILDVARSLGFQLVRTGCFTWNVKDESSKCGYSSLCLFKESNRWYRFSGKGHPSSGSPIDLVMYALNWSFKQACEWLSTSFPQYTWTLNNYQQRYRTTLKASALSQEKLNNQCSLVGWSMQTAIIGLLHQS